MKKKYFITGGAGFIGANFVKYMLSKYGPEIEMIVLDKLTYAGNLKTLENELDRIDFIKGDICDKELVEGIFSENKIDYIVNFAAESHVDRSIEDPELFLRTNILGTHNLLNISRKHWEESEGKYKEGARFLQISTDEVYGSLEEGGFFTEETSLNPRSPYSASKAGADVLVGSYIETYNFPAIITRCSNNYGPYQFPEKLVALMINNILTGKRLPIYGDGENVRDWLHVDDHCRAVDLVLKKGRIGEVYNIGGCNEKKNIDTVKIIIDSVKRLAKENPEYGIDSSKVDHRLIKYVKDRKGHDRRYAIDPTKIGEELSWCPETRFEDGIVQTVKWYFDNQDWVKSVLSGEYQEYYQRIYGKE